MTTINHEKVKFQPFMSTVNRYSEPEQFDYLWNLKINGKAKIVYWVGNIYCFEGVR